MLSFHVVAICVQDAMMMPGMCGPKLCVTLSKILMASNPVCTEMRETVNMLLKHSQINLLMLSSMWLDIFCSSSIYYFVYFSL